MATQTRTAPVVEATERGSAPVVAAGTLCWRMDRNRLEVLVIHRPRYDDWSWPKGKLDAGETTPECAVRETFEEVGLNVRLGIPLNTIHYPIAAGDKLVDKTVYYWAARIERALPVPDGKEVDGTAWVSPERAREMLSNPTDLEPLDALVEAHSAKDLATWPLVVVRHAKAKPRSSWSRAEGERPLAATGRRQAAAVNRLLQAWTPQRVVSSPWIRCVQTISPYVTQRSAKLKLSDALTERNAARKPRRTRNAVERVLDKRQPVAICTHRPVLPLVLGVLARRMDASLSGLLPTEDPYLAPGEAIICQVSHAHQGRIVSVEQFRSYDD